MNDHCTLCHFNLGYRCVKGGLVCTCSTIYCEKCFKHLTKRLDLKRMFQCEEEQDEEEKENEEKDVLEDFEWNDAMFLKECPNCYKVAQKIEKKKFIVHKIYLADSKEKADEIRSLDDGNVFANVEENEFEINF